MTRGSTKKKVTAVKPSRIGRVQFSSYHAPEAGRQLKILAAAYRARRKPTFKRILGIKMISLKFGALQIPGTLDLKPKSCQRTDRDRSAFHAILPITRSQSMVTAGTALICVWPLSSRMVARP